MHMAAMDMVMMHRVVIKMVMQMVVIKMVMDMMAIKMVAIKMVMDMVVIKMVMEQGELTHTTTVATVAIAALPDRLGGDAHVVVLRELCAVQHCRPAKDILSD